MRQFSAIRAARGFEWPARCAADDAPAQAWAIQDDAVHDLAAGDCVERAYVGASLQRRGARASRQPESPGLPGPVAALADQEAE